MLVEVLLHQVAEQGRAESNFTVGDANDLQDLKTQGAGPITVFPRVVHGDSRKETDSWFVLIFLGDGRSRETWACALTHWCPCCACLPSMLALVALFVFILGLLVGFGLHSGS